MQTKIKTHENGDVEGLNVSMYITRIVLGQLNGKMLSTYPENIRPKTLTSLDTPEELGC